MTIGIITSFVVAAILWVICIKDWTSGACKAGLLAWFVSKPAILATIVFIILVTIKAFFK